MNPTERVYTIERLIRQRGTVNFATLLAALEVSPATLKRDLEYLRSRLGAPIVYDATERGYRFDGDNTRGARHELPGLWFNEGELYSLLMAHQLLSEVDEGGLLARHLQPLLERIHQMLGGLGGQASSASLMQRVKIVAAARRAVPSRLFEVASQALLQRRRLFISYLTRSRGQSSEREVSPQRLVHHRGTWYLDAWCHSAHALRRFALDAMSAAELRDTAAHELPLPELQAAMDAGYGIFSSGAKQWATLRFDADAARWVSSESWHAEQRGAWISNGEYELTLPFTNPRELLMDVLRHAGHVRVLAPASLADALRAALARGLQVASAGVAPAAGEPA